MPLIVTPGDNGFRQEGMSCVVELPPTAPASMDGHVTLRTLILIRWVAVLGQFAAVMVVQYVLQFPMPLGPVLATIGASVVLNLVATAQRGGRRRLADSDAALYLGYDMLQLSLLLYLTGGLSNPFVILLLAPMTVAAAILSQTSVILLTALNLICLTVLALWHFPLPWSEPQQPVPSLYAVGIWLSLTLSAVFIATYVFRMAEEARRFAGALAASQVALVREQRLSSLGALAAAAAHELGTPLGTIALVAKELARELPPDSPHAEDVALLQSQSQRCREILAELARKPEADGGDPFERLPLSALVEAAGGPHRAGHIQFTVTAAPAPGAGEDVEEPIIRRSPEIVHGIGNFIQNAHQFARARVTAVASWDARTVTVMVIDDGPGFPAHLLDRIGEPYLSARVERSGSGHMGLGIFIAQTLLEKTGATITYGNMHGGGACVAIRWNRHRLESDYAWWTTQ
jgi:two-component system sensor histidine kinase RegB